MSGAWAVRVARDDAASLAVLRAFAGVDIAEVDHAVWARGRDINDGLDRAIRTLPGSRRYTVLDDGQLVPHGRRVPQGRLPPAEWRPLPQWLVVELPPAALPAAALPADWGPPSAPDQATSVLRRTALKLERCPYERPATALATGLAAWVDYCATAAEVRLKPLAFAVANDGRVLVRGAPLPPLAGERYAVDGVVAVPCGWALAPRLDADLVRGWLQAREDDLLLFAPDGSYERIAGDDFVAAGRSAARASAREARHD